MMKRYALYIVGLLSMLAVSCQQDEPLGTNEKGMLSYSVQMPARDASRVAVDGSKINSLIVEVFEQEGESWKSAWRKKGITVTDGKATIDVPLLKNRSYKVVFWAQNKDVNAYGTDDLSHISVDYTDYCTGFENVENLDAFYQVDTVDDLVSGSNGEVQLKRPFVFLNIDNQSEYQPTSTTLTVDKVYTSFFPLTGKVGESEKRTFTFNGAKDDGTIAACLLFLPSEETTINVSLSINNGTTVTTKDVTINEVKANHRYNLEGELVGAPINHWNEKTELPSYDETNSRYVIQNEAQLAWWMNPVTTELKEGVTEILIEKDLDMQDIPMDALSLPEGFTLDGNNKTIKRLKLSGGLLGDATKVNVCDLVITDAEVASSTSHVGVLVNTLKGSGTFTNVSISNSSATTTNGAAGGMIGYIVRTSETDREESLEVKIEGCDISQTTLEATNDKGQFVGLLSGYDNGEKLTFTDCTATNVEVSGSYHNFLGNETYCRGLVTIDNNRFMPKWDGTRTVEPLLANTTYDGSDVTSGSNKYVVYSSFDLAGIRQKTASPSAIYLKADIDMNGQGADGKYNVPSCFTQSAYVSDDDNSFEPFSYITTLDGLNHTIYNLSISQPEKTIAAFILYASGTTVHKNITFKNACTVSTHKEVETDAKAYGAILVSNVDATYTMENVHAYDCKVFALQKVGTLAARVSGTSTLKNNSVNNCYVENYVCNISERFESGSKTVEIGSTSVTIDNVYADFYPYGEVGGMYGFIQGNSTLADCKVNGTTVYAYGQDDKEATIAASGLKGNIVKAVVKTAGYYLVPGRHVSTFIGNIRATGKVTITGCTVDANTQCTNRHDKHNDTYTSIGQAYIVKFVDSEGTVTVDGNKLTLADCNRNTKR